MPHGRLLLQFCDAAVGRRADLAEIRAAVRRELGDTAAIEAAANIANFQRMVRIADGCGIPLDDRTKEASEGWRDQLGLHQYASAANTA